MKKGKWYTKVSNWIVIIACIILIPILVFNIAIMYQAKTNKDKVPSVFGYKPFMVLSGSMESEILKGDLIITKIVDPETLKVDDIIAFRDNEGTVTTHRIIDIVEIEGVTYFVTKGDNNNSQDQNLVEFEDVEGIYIKRIPGIGNAMNSLADPNTIIIVVLGVTVIFAVGFMINSKKEKDAEQAEFLEYKRLKELEEKKEEEDKKNSLKKESKKDSSKSTSKKGTASKNTKKSK